jgi:AI-2 transport protein TqsA
MVTFTDVSEERSRLIAASLVILAAVATAAALYFTRPVMVPFVLAIFVYYLMLPLVDLLDFKLKMPRALSVLITLLVVSGLLALLGLLITTSARGLLESQDIYRQKLADWAERALAILVRWDIDIGQQSLIDTLRQMPIMRVVQRTAGTMLGLVTNGFLVLIFVIFLLLGRRTGRPQSGIFVAIDYKIRQFIVMKFVLSATTGILVGLILALFGLDLALVFGVLAFLLNFIPSIGSVISTFLPLPIALVQFDSLWAVLGVVLLPGAVQMVIGNGIEPKVMGEGLDLSPVTILLALVFWGLLGGVIGMLMAAPITAVLRIVLARFHTTRPVAELMAGRFAGEEAARG